MPAPNPTDVALRQQAITERVKATQYVNATKLRGDIERSLKDAFQSVAGKGNFGAMTRGEFQSFLSRVTKDTSGLLVEYKSDALDFLEDLTGAQRELAINVYSKLSGKSIEGVPGADKLFDKIMGREMAANGLTMEQTLQSGSDYTMGLIVRRLRQAQADGEKIDDTLRAILGDDALGNRDGLLNKLENAYRAGSNTNVQNVVSVTNATVCQTVYDYYTWVSTLDERTTEICQSRNGNVYKYGEGPMPPAHWNCRSTTIPASGEAPESAPEDAAKWLATQPKKVRDFLSNPRPLPLSKLPSASKIILQGTPKDAPIVPTEPQAPEPYKSTEGDFDGLVYTDLNEEQRKVYDRVIGMTPRDFFDELTADVPKFVDKANSYKTLSIGVDDTGGVNYNMRLVDANFNEVAFIARDLVDEDSLKVAKAEVFTVAKDYQSGGFAKTMLRNQMNQWRDLGVKRVDIHAALDVGGYAWARYGYVPNAVSWPKTASKMADRLAAMKDVPTEDRAFLTKLFKSDDPKSIWLAADSVYGKRLLLGLDWFGSLDLTDAASMTRFNAYVG